ncbi:MAG: aminopeptidase P family protein [Bacteroidetes bacterium]|nr:aminopeptidase P family protein [Bacteroidota bacterium]
MFDKKVYIDRRSRLRSQLKSGLVLLLGNSESAMNYTGNTYPFRQDSNFLYFFGLDHPDMAGIMDIENDKDYIFGNDVTMDDIIWMGPQPLIKNLAKKVGINYTAPFGELGAFLQQAITSGRKIHFLPPYRGEHTILLKQLLGLLTARVRDYVSEELIKAVVTLRSVKDEGEIIEIEKALDVTYEMYITAMKMAMPGVYEREIAGVMEGISLSKCGPVSFPIILTINGQTLHNHYHGNKLIKDKMVVIDSGAESELHYSSDITRTVPVGGIFNPKQKAIYQIVLDANLKAIGAIKPGIYYKEVHLLAAKTVASGLKELGIMKGNVEEAVSNGAHSLFFPHGLGHMMGLDVHDMENLGENFVGYDNTVNRSEQFGLAFLRLARKLQPGFVLTVEPGIYFIPELIEQWKSEKKFTDFINYKKIDEYRDTGGVRIEDDILVTKNGCYVLGKPVPKTVKEIEKIMAK